MPLCCCRYMRAACRSRRDARGARRTGRRARRPRQRCARTAGCGRRAARRGSRCRPSARDGAGDVEGGAQVLDRREQLVTPARVARGDLPLGVVEAAGLVEDDLGDDQLADIVQQGAAAQVVEVLLVHAQLRQAGPSSAPPAGCAPGSRARAFARARAQLSMAAS